MLLHLTTPWPSFHHLAQHKVSVWDLMNSWTHDPTGVHSTPPWASNSYSIFILLGIHFQNCWPFSRRVDCCVTLKCAQTEYKSPWRTSSVITRRHKRLSPSLLPLLESVLMEWPRQRGIRPSLFTEGNCQTHQMNHGPKCDAAASVPSLGGYG